MKRGAAVLRDVATNLVGIDFIHQKVVDGLRWVRTISDDDIDCKIDLQVRPRGRDRDVVPGILLHVKFEGTSCTVRVFEAISVSRSRVHGIWWSSGSHTHSQWASIWSDSTTSISHRPPSTSIGFDTTFGQNDRGQPNVIAGEEFVSLRLLHGVIEEKFLVVVLLGK